MCFIIIINNNTHYTVPRGDKISRLLICYCRIGQLRTNYVEPYLLCFWLSINNRNSFILKWLLQLKVDREKYLGQHELGSSASEIGEAVVGVRQLSRDVLGGLPLDPGLGFGV